MMLVWVVLGIPLAIDKGQIGRLATWVGCMLSVHDANGGGVLASILECRMSEISTMADDIASKNTVGMKEPRTFTGKCQSVAGPLYMWRPFVHMFYAALHSPAGDAPLNCRWTRQILVPLTWMRAFLRGSAGELERYFTVSAYLREGDQITITTDVSPWGLGGVLEINHQIVAYFADRIHDKDRRVLSIEQSPSSSDQQVLEALALLVALRQWASHWTNKRVQLSVRARCNLIR